MFSIKGHYSWKLVNKDTGKVDMEGEQDNLFTLAGYRELVFNITWSHNNKSYAPYIFTSEDTPTPGVNYARILDGIPFSVTSSLQGYPATITKTSWEASVNMNPPGSAKTIRIIGTTDSGDLMSFIELSTPIPQATNQFLYITYRVEFAVQGVGIKAPFNNWILDKISSPNSDWPNSNSFSSCNFYITMLKPAINQNLVGRPSGQNQYGAGEISSTSSLFIYNDITLGTTSNAGPHGAVVVQTNPDEYNTDSTLWFIASNPDAPIDPYATIMFPHGINDTGWFNNISEPPTGSGVVVESGTPTNDHFYKGVRTRISKSGDASDIIPETFTTNFAVNNELTVGQDWANVLPNQVTCELSTTVTLPAPLAIDTEYWINWVDATHITLSASEGGAVITLTDDGTGTHTITRTSTGKFLLETSDYTETSGQSNSAPMEIAGQVCPVNMAVNLRIHNYIRWSKVINNGSDTFMYYTVLFNGVWYIMKWRFCSIETGDVVISAITSPVEAKVIGTDIYYCDSSGLHVLDTTNDTVTNYSAGLLNTICTDLAYDDTTNMLWIGHDLGVTKFNPSTNLVVSTHTIGGGETFDGLTADQVKVSPGTLSARDGFVIKGGYHIRVQNTGDGSSVWVYDNGNTGKYEFIDYTEFYQGSVLSVLLRGNGLPEFVAVGGGDFTNYSDYNDVTNALNWSVWSVDFSGTPSHAKEQEALFNQPYASPWYDYGPWKGTASRIFQTNADEYRFFQGFIFGSYGGVAREKYILSTNTISHEVQFGGEYHWGRTDFVYGPETKTAFNESEFLRTHFIMLGCFYRISIPVKYGWNGSDWKIDVLEGKDIPDTANVDLDDGLFFNFDNAGGIPSENQFIEGENYSRLSGPGMIKTNLETLTYDRIHHYFLDVSKAEDVALTIASGEIELPEEITADFRKLIVDDDGRTCTSYPFYIREDGGAEFTESSSGPPPAGQYYIPDPLIAKFEFNSADNGKNMLLDYYYGELH